MGETGLRSSGWDATSSSSTTAMRLHASWLSMWTQKSLSAVEKPNLSGVAHSIRTAPSTSLGIAASRSCGTPAALRYATQSLCDRVLSTEGVMCSLSSCCCCWCCCCCCCCCCCWTEALFWELYCCRCCCGCRWYGCVETPARPRLPCRLVAGSLDCKVSECEERESVCVCVCVFVCLCVCVFVCARDEKSGWGFHYDAHRHTRTHTHARTHAPGRQAWPMRHLRQRPLLRL